ncbi:MAG: TRAP-type mannitol/chloroaromatic compound transport system permease small subunit [Alphaproteobacteria bacterium]|jgi:TRAP-type mannitol/chloroaromatic compound transport system permease small subunit
MFVFATQKDIVFLMKLFYTMRLIHKISFLCQYIADSLWVFLLIALPTCIVISAGNAFIRKISDLGSNAFLEMQWYLFSAIFLLGAGTVLKNDGHIRIDIFYAKMSPKAQALMNIILHSLLTAPILMFLIYLSIPFFLASISPADHVPTLLDVPTYLFNPQFHEISPNAGGLSTWYAKILLPVGFTLLLFAVVADILRKIIFLQSPEIISETQLETSL